ncbi:Homeodomain-like protein [Spinellus fusiger]|nr:Homeodomain-like protein [Spinellus fusiger]
MSALRKEKTTLHNQDAFSVFKQDGSQQFYCRWTAAEDHLLSRAIEKYGTHRWTAISKLIPGRTPVQCSTRWLGALNPNVHKGRWSKEEDSVLLSAVNNYLSDGTKQPSSLPWSRIALDIPHRTGIQCQARWTEALDPAVRKGRWQADEDDKLQMAVARFGCCWIRVAGLIPSRTQRQCRTRWNQICAKQDRKKVPVKVHKSISNVYCNQPILFMEPVSRDAFKSPRSPNTPPLSPLPTTPTTQYGDISKTPSTKNIFVYPTPVINYTIEQSFYFDPDLPSLMLTDIEAPLDFSHSLFLMQ